MDATAKVDKEMAKNFLPPLEVLKGKQYITYRRYWLDAMLFAFAGEMRGMVLDLGGIRLNKRGSFEAPERQAKYWLYLNKSLDASPHVLADVTQTPLGSRSVDCVICTEVLEHLPNPQACVAEMHRLLREGGVVLVSIPFFYPVHADPFDYQRFTEDGLRHLFSEFYSLDVYRMGGFAGVLGLLLEIGIEGMEGNSLSALFLRWIMKWFSRFLCKYDLMVFKRENDQWRKFTTGYFVRAIR